MADGTKIEALSETDCAYLAGLIDGEGTIYVMRHNGRNGATTFYPAVTIQMTDLGVMRWCSEALGLAVSKTSDGPRKPGWKVLYAVRMHGKKAIALCRRLVPHLKVKRRQAEMIQAFPFEQRRGVPRSGRALPEAVVAAREKLRSDVNVLNSRGSAGRLLDGVEHNGFPT